MESLVKLKSLSSQISLEAAEDRSSLGNPYSPDNDECPDGIFVHSAALPNGKRIKLLKTLLSSACERDCYYCPFRAGRDFRRASFRPEEFARLFIMLYQKGIAEGLFLSSGMIGGGTQTQDKLIATAEILRIKLGFRGYLHLKIMPGAELAQVAQSMKLADRVSVNLEAPNDKRLAYLAPHKRFIQELLQPLEWIEQIRQSQPEYQGWNGHWPSSVTQFVAGGSMESDLELLSTTEFLYRKLRLRRAYFSPFNPIPDTPLENAPPTPSIRERHLYQASFLLRDYGFILEEMPFEPDGSLPVKEDPKLAWAQKNLSQRPIEVNKADVRTLMRVPGIGVKGARAIIQTRRQTKIQDISVLKKLGIRIERAVPYLLLDGQQSTYQPLLF